MRRINSVAMASTTLVFGLGCLVATSRGLQAQTAMGNGSVWQRSVSVGWPAIENQTSLQLATVGIQFTQMHPGRVGLDFSAGTMPYTLAEGALSLGARAGLALPLQLSKATILMPSAGLSAFSAAAIPDAVITTSGGRGFNVGLSLITADSAGTGIRISTTRHQLRGAKTPVWLMELGFLLPPKR